MENSNGSHYVSRVASSEAARPKTQRRGRKRKHTSDALAEPENVQPSAKRHSTGRSRRSPSYNDDSTSAGPSSTTAAARPPVGPSMPSISRSGGSSVGGNSHSAAINDYTSDTQSSSDCLSNGVEFDLYQLASPASVSSSGRSPSCGDVAHGDATAANPAARDDAIGNQQHHLQHQQPHQHSGWLPKGDTTPHGNKKVDVLGEVPEWKSSNASATAPTATATCPLVESCYWSYKQRSCPMPSLSWADSSEMWKRMCRKDDRGWLDRDPNMFNDHPGLQSRMRAILLDWLNEVCEVYKMYRETYYLAVDYIDRYLSRKKGLEKTHLQLLGVTALFIAAKVEEIYPPKLQDFAYVTDGACTEEDILREEVLLLCELEWNISPLTVMGWLGLYMQINVTTREPESQLRHVRAGAAQPSPQRANVTDENVDLRSTSATMATMGAMQNTGSPIATSPVGRKASTGANKTDEAFVYPQFSAMEFAHTAQLIDLCSLDVGMASFKYSVIAAAAISHTFDRITACLVSGLSWEEIAPCAKWMEPYFQVICEENANYPLTFLEVNEQIKTGHGLKLISPKLLTDLYYNKQTHTTSLEMLDMVAIKIEELESSERMVQLEASPAPLGTIESEIGILTPPASNRKSLEMILTGDGGGSGAGGNEVKQHPPHQQQEQQQQHQQQPRDPELQTLPGRGVIVEQAMLKRRAARWVKVLPSTAPASVRKRRRRRCNVQ